MALVHEYVKPSCRDAGRFFVLIRILKEVGKLKRVTREIMLERFNAVHGDKWDYSKAFYEGKDSKVVIGCPIHGDFKQSPGNHYKGQGCPVCGDIKCAKSNTDTKESFIEKAKKVHGEVYCYDKVDYVGSSTHVTMTCSIHGDFSMTPSCHISGQGCRQCAVNKLAEINRFTTEEYIEKARNTHGDKYDYSQVRYVRSTGKVAIVCKEHGLFLQEAASHLTGIGCPLCAIASRSIKKTKSLEEFIESAKAVHGDLFGYSKVDYKNCKDKIYITCKEHGEFLQQPSNHLSGMGCPKCSVYGFDKTRSGWLYVATCGEFIKVGVTGRDVDKRLTELSKSREQPYKEVYSRYFENGQECFDKETEVLRILKSFYSTCEKGPDGYSETFKDADLAHIVNVCSKKKETNG